jgi:hypothetical protein
MFNLFNNTSDTKRGVAKYCDEKGIDMASRLQFIEHIVALTGKDKSCKDCPAFYYFMDTLTFNTLDYYWIDFISTIKSRIENQ